MQVSHERPTQSSSNLTNERTIQLVCASTVRPRRVSLSHGTRWGDWTLDADRLCLVYRAQPTDWDGTIVYLGRYECDLERCSTSGQTLDWIFQIRGKSWATPRVVADLLAAIRDVIHPQANLCSGGGERRIKDIGSFLRKRIAAEVAA